MYIRSSRIVQIKCDFKQEGTFKVEGTFKGNHGYTKVSARNLYTPETCTVALFRTQDSLNGSLYFRYFILLNRVRVQRST